MTVYAQPQATFSYSPALPVAGVATTFSAASSGSLSSYAWSLGDGTTATGASASHTYARRGTYRVTLVSTNAFGLSSSVSEVVTVINRPPVAVVNVVSGLRMPRRAVRFSGARSHNNVPIVSYRWHFGDGVGGVGKNITHTYARAGTYRVSLSVRDGFGATGTTTTTIHVGRAAASAPNRRRR